MTNHITAKQAVLLFQKLQPDTPLCNNCYTKIQNKKCNNTQCNHEDNQWK